MSVIDPRFVIDLVEGRFGRTSRTELDALFAEAADHDHICLHVHGGLVKHHEALNSIPILQQTIEPHARPIFVTWNSGAVETLVRNLDEIAKDALAQRLFAWAQDEAERTEDHPSGFTSEEAQAKALAAALARDEDLERGLRAARDREAAGFSLIPQVVSSSVLKELFETAAGINWMSLALRLVRIVAAAAKRQMTEPGRPFLATLFEETIRSLFGDVLGEAYWTAMKGDTREAFANHDDRGGRHLLQRLAEWWQPGRRISFIGHSAGGVFFCHLLQHANLLPEDCRLDAILIAPACSFELLHASLQSAGGSRLGRMRVFGLSDVRERGYWEWFYPASLLYLVSGLLEDKSDKPLLGMERYWDETRYPSAGDEALNGVRTWFTTHESAAFWSPHDGEPGTETQGDTHGSISEELVTLESVGWLLENKSWDASGSFSRPKACRVVERWQRAARSFPIHRRQPAPTTGGQGFRAAVGQVDLTRELYQSTFGYGPGKAKGGEGWFGRLRAVMMLFEDDRGERALVLGADLHSGARYLTEALAWHLADIGLSVDRIVFTSSHTHSGHGRFYGVPTYDRLAGRIRSLFDGFDVRGTARMVERMVREARRLEGQLRPARIGTGHSDAWGTLWNRSLPPYLGNFFEPTTTSEDTQRNTVLNEARRWHPGGEVPTDLSLDHLAVDARIRVLVVGPDEDGAPPWGALAFMGASPTLSASHLRWYSSDAFGSAAKAVERTLQKTMGRHVPIGVVGSANGDVNVVVRGMPFDTLQRARNRDIIEGANAGEPRHVLDRRAAGVHVVRRAAEAIASHVVDAISTGWAAAKAPSQINIRFEESVIPEATGPIEAPDAPPHLGAPSIHQYKLPCTWMIGESTFATSELNRAWEPVPPEQGVERSKRLKPDERALQIIEWRDPHSPKKPPVNIAGSPLQEWLSFIGPVGSLGLDPYLPLHLLSFDDDVHIAGLPAELSVHFSRELRQALDGTLGGEVLLGALAGGYTGYASTIGEYAVQDYEGSSVYWGRHFGSLIRQRLATLAAASPQPVGEGTPGTAYFVRNQAPLEEIAITREDEDDAGFRPGPDLGVLRRKLEGIDNDPSLVRLVGSWSPRKKPQRQGRSRIGSPQPAGTWFVRLMEGDTPLMVNGSQVDDLTHDMGVWFDRKERRWVFVLEMPKAVLAGRKITYDLLDDDRVRPAGAFHPPEPKSVDEMPDVNR